MADISNINLPNGENYDIKDKAARNDIAINRTTLGTQCRNLHDTLSVNWYQPSKTSVASDGTVTTTITSDSRSFTYANSEHYITLEAGNYIITVNTLEFVSGSAALIRGCNSDGQSLFALPLSSVGLHKAAFSLSKKTTIGIMYKLYSQTCTIMIRDADILDDTYEPYKESVDERLIQNKSDMAVNKSTLGYQRKNILDETGYLSSITSVTRGTKSISGNQITLTATADNCFTNPHTSSDGGYRIPVEPDTDYILSWESDNTYAGLVYVFMNGNTSNYKNANNKVSKYIKFTTNSDTTFITIRLAVATSGNSITYSNIMLRYADITDSTYEPYQPSVQEQINNFGTQQQLLCDYSSSATSSVTIQITGLFSNYSAVICIVKYSYGTTSFTLPLKYIKSIGKSKEYSPVLDLGFRYVDDNNLLIGGADAAISSVKIISLY